MASNNKLAILSNLDRLNSILMKNVLPRKDRVNILLENHRLTKNNTQSIGNN